MTNPAVKMFFHEPTYTLSYVVRDPLSQSAVIIDPVLDYEHAAGRTSTTHADAILEYIAQENLDVSWVLETHAHADHLTAAPYLSEQTGASIAIGKGICEVQKTFRDIFNFQDMSVDGSQFGHLLNDGEHISAGSLDIRILHTPGHTNDSISYLIGDAAFIGDTLFAPDYGSARTDFPGGSAILLYQSIQKLFSLPDSTRLFLCHDYMPDDRELEHVHTVAFQKTHNIHANSNVSEAEFVQMREKRDSTLSMPGLIIPSIQTNIQAGNFPAAESNGISYLKLPINRLGH